MDSSCKRCLIQDSINNKYYKTVLEYINSLDASIKTDDTTYKLRLSLCKECDFLINGICNQCGCFVEIRACKKDNYCPNINSKW
ncbi:DUF6171 family protein [Clostridium sp. SHJSY1]|uniref:DUF6171 family protein n=1 Tax=Clostridium sp. SHJSY1 TaxID=2942483 RepID=UPI002874F7BF|nr:DUF6171 family protein [Clostridium sp. SHJSY1]MDS0524677.1 DUF6171 family protein [Clostridium sp. SHJSY1]